MGRTDSVKGEVQRRSEDARAKVRSGRGYMYMAATRIAFESARRMNS